MAQMGQNTKHGANRVSIRVKAAALNIEDHHIASGWCANYNLWKRDPLEAANRAFMRLRGNADNVKTEAVHGGYTDSGTEFPITLGREFSGVIIDAPHGLEYDYPVGMKVIGYLPPHQKGALAEIVSLPVIQCAPMPTNLSFTEAAGLAFAGHYLMNALNRLSDARTPITQLLGRLYRSRFLSLDKIADQVHLVVGIGGTGSLLVQLLKSLGASRVDVVCSESARELAVELGATNVIVYDDKTKEALIDQLIHTAPYYGVFDCSRGASIPLQQWVGYVLDPAGRVVSFDSPEMAIKDSGNNALATVLTWKYQLMHIERQIEKEIQYHGSSSKMRFKFSTVKIDQSNVTQLARHVQRGAVKPVIDSVFQFDQIQEALERLERGHLRGKIIVNIGDDAHEGSQHNAFYYSA